MGEGVSPVKRRNERPIPFTVERTADPVSPSRVKGTVSERDETRDEFVSGSGSLKGIDWDERTRKRGSNDSQVQGEYLRFVQPCARAE